MKVSNINLLPEFPNLIASSQEQSLYYCTFHLPFQRQLNNVLHRHVFFLCGIPSTFQRLHGYRYSKVTASSISILKLFLTPFQHWFRRINSDNPNVFPKAHSCSYLGYSCHSRVDNTGAGQCVLFPTGMFPYVALSCILTSSCCRFGRTTRQPVTQWKR